MLNILICDDNQVETEQMKTLLAKCLTSDMYKVDTLNSTESLKKYLNEKRVDILILDILLGSDNGIELMKNMISKCKNTALIFVSSNIEFCTDVYDVPHLGFLDKPIKLEKFQNAIYRARNFLKEKIISIQTTDRILWLDVDQIEYIENKDRKTYLFLSSGEEHICKVKLSQFEKELPQEIFIKSHSSYLINLRKILKVNKNNLYFKNDKIVPLSKRHIKNLRVAIANTFKGA